MVYIAILGLGIVGTGVAKVLERNGATITAAAGEEVRLKYALVRHDRPDSPYRNILTTDFSVIENDPEVSVVVETIGGCGAAKEYTERCLKAGKHVITANKALVSEYGRGLLELARLNHVSYLFEASVGGGTPLIRPLYFDLAANNITEIKGIVNGTTNYILSCMREREMTFETALRHAQEKGYAEANPEDDVNGQDAARKLSILAALAWHRELPPERVTRLGLEQLQLKDVQIASTFGGRFKLVAQAKMLPDGKLAAWVAPQLVLPGSMLYAVEYVFNGIIVTGDMVGDVMFCATGAGGIPTASSVLSDLIHILQHRDNRLDISWDEAPETWGRAPSVSSRWYVRDGVHWSLTMPMTREEAQKYPVHYRVLEA